MTTAMLVVLRKEAIDAWRDRRSIVSASSYALWAPFAIALALTALARDRSADQPIEIALAGARQAASLTAYLREQPDLRLVELDMDPHESVRLRKVAVALVIPDTHAQRFRAAKPAPVELIYDSAVSGSAARADRVRRMLAAYGKQVADTRLVMRGIVPDAVAPIDVKDRDVSTAAGRAGHLLAMLPIFLLVAAFTGGMNVAIDATAGERERGSLESLLSNPVSTMAIAAGKWIAAAAASAVSVVLVIAVTAAVLRLPAIRAIDLPIGLSLGEAVAASLVLLPLALLAPALQMLASVFAASYKEAQTHVSMLLLVPMVPGFLIAFGSLKDSQPLRLLPIASQQLLLTDILAGVTPDIMAAAAAALVTTAAAVLALVATARLLARERIVAGGAR